jgi:hypothetical protein
MHRTLTARPSGRRAQQCGLRVRVAEASRFAGAWNSRPGAQCQRRQGYTRAKRDFFAPAHRARTHVHAHTCARPRAHTFGNVHTHTHAHTSACTHVYACIRMHAHTHSGTCTCTHTHAYTRAHSRSHALQHAHALEQAWRQDSAHPHNRDYEYRIRTCSNTHT